MVEPSSYSSLSPSSHNECQSWLNTYVLYLELKHAIYLYQVRCNIECLNVWALTCYLTYQKITGPYARVTFQRTRHYTHTLLQRLGVP